MNSPAPTAEAVLTHLCKSVVTDPDAVSIEAFEDEHFISVMRRGVEWAATGKEKN